jgi:hypothetical protein
MASGQGQANNFSPPSHPSDIYKLFRLISVAHTAIEVLLATRVSTRSSSRITTAHLLQPHISGLFIPSGGGVTAPAVGIKSSTRRRSLRRIRLTLLSAFGAPFPPPGIVVGPLAAAPETARGRRSSRLESSSESYARLEYLKTSSESSSQRHPSPPLAASRTLERSLSFINGAPKQVNGDLLAYSEVQDFEIRLNARIRQKQRRSIIPAPFDPAKIAPLQIRGSIYSSEESAI